MNSHQQYGKRIWCWILALCLMLSLVACYPAPATHPSTPSTSPSTNPRPSEPNATSPTFVVNPTEPTDPTLPTEPPEPTSPEIIWDGLEYILTQNDVDLFYALLDQCEMLALEGQDMDSIDASSNALDAQYEYLNAQCTIAQIQHYCDTSDSVRAQQYLDCAEICIQAGDAYIQMARRVYLSDTPAKDLLFADWTEQDFAMLMAYDEEIALLRQRNEEITVEYYANEDDDTLIPLYIEFVQNNNQIARYYGYDNYYEYAYELVYNRDYQPDELEQMRQYVKEYIVPVFHQSYLNCYHTIPYLSQADWDGLNHFLEADYNSADRNYVDLYIQTVPDSMADALRRMLEEDSLFVTNESAKAIAFTTMIGDRSFCFFGPSYASSSTVIHEGGHYYASLYSDLDAIPMDLAEVHSQGNEWLFIHAMKQYMSTAQYDALVDFRIYNDLATVLICLMVDEFESKVYSTDISEFTAEDFDALMESVATQYFSMSYISHYIADISWYWRMVVVDQPVYYISYAVSAIAALDLYTVAMTDFDAAISAYQMLCEHLDEELGFLGNLESAGLSGPFREAFYQRVAQLVEDRL